MKPRFTKQPELAEQAHKIAVTGMAFIDEVMPGANDHAKMTAFLNYIGGAADMAAQLGESTLGSHLLACTNYTMKEMGFVK